MLVITTIMIIAISWVCVCTFALGTATLSGDGRAQLRPELRNRFGLNDGEEVRFWTRSTILPNVRLPIVIQREGWVQCGAIIWKLGTPEADEIFASLDADGVSGGIDFAGAKLELKPGNMVLMLARSFVFWIMMLAVAVRFVPGFRRLARAKRSIDRSRTACLLCKYEVTKLRRCPECGASPQKRSNALMATIRGALSRRSRTNSAT